MRRTMMKILGWAFAIVFPGQLLFRRFPVLGVALSMICSLCSLVSMVIALGAWYMAAAGFDVMLQGGLFGLIGSTYPVGVKFMVTTPNMFLLVALVSLALALLNAWQAGKTVAVRVVADI